MRDIITFESPKVVTGMHDESQLHWGGDIDLPKGREITAPPPALEPLTGVHEPHGIPRSVEPPHSEDGRRLALPGPGGARMLENAAVVDAPALPPAHRGPLPSVLKCRHAHQLTSENAINGGDGRPRSSKKAMFENPTRHGPLGPLVPPVESFIESDNKANAPPVTFVEHLALPSHVSQHPHVTVPIAKNVVPPSTYKQQDMVELVKSIRAFIEASNDASNDVSNGMSNDVSNDRSCDTSNDESKGVTGETTHHVPKYPLRTRAAPSVFPRFLSLRIH
jgi:hypothetical protein